MLVIPCIYNPFESARHSLLLLKVNLFVPPLDKTREPLPRLNKFKSEFVKDDIIIAFCIVLPAIFIPLLQVTFSLKVFIPVQVLPNGNKFIPVEPFAIALILPFASIVIFVFVYVPAVAPV